NEDPTDPKSTVLHVIGRTYSVPHKYSYRRFAHQMWTPREPVTPDIEGGHVTAGVWRGGADPVWGTVRGDPPPPGVQDDGKDTGPAGGKALGTLKAEAARAMAMGSKQLDIQLCWSEYYQGAWTARESGGFGVVDGVSVPLDFDAKSVFIHAAKEYDGM